MKKGESNEEKYRNISFSFSIKCIVFCTSTQQFVASNYINSLDIVANPAKYLNKKVAIKGKFDKFSTLGLDYAPAMKSSEEFITFLIQRDDIKDHNIPLSEMKIFIKRAEAEKKVKALGGTTKSSVVKGLSYLVTNDTTSGSAKNVKAQSLGIPVINEEEFLKML